MKINREGTRIIIFTAGICIALGAVILFLLPLWLSVPLSAGLAVLLGLVVWFFREPERPVVDDPSIVYSPADGKIVVVERTLEKEYFHDERLQVSIFMSVTNVHVNWYPVGGTVKYFKYHPGKFLVAWHPKSSEQNERTTTVVDTGSHRVLFRQIAGFVARRIVCYAREGKSVVQNEKCGFIKFGSRIDLLLPEGSEVLVEMGQKVTGSQTPIARLK